MLAAVYALVAAVATGSVGMTILALILTGAGAWGTFWQTRFFLRIPVDVSILDDGLMQFRMRRGAETASPGAINAIRLTDSGSYSHLRVRTDAARWYLPTNVDEGEDLIRTMTALNPNIRVEHREESD